MSQDETDLGSGQGLGPDLDGLLRGLSLPDESIGLGGDQDELARLQAENLALRSELIEIKAASGRSQALNGEGRDDRLRVLEEALQDAGQALLTAGLRLRRMANVSNLLIHRLRAHEADAQATEARGREMSHRIKNSLQLIVSLLRLRSKNLNNVEAQDALAVAMACIDAVAQVQALLYDASAPAAEEVAFDRYLDELGQALGRLVGGKDRQRHLVVRSEPLVLPADTVQTLGILVSELTINAFRHAYPPDTPGTVRIKAAVDAEGRLGLTVADDGKGFAAEVLQGTGKGLTLIRLLAKQIGAEIRIEHEAGTRVTLTLPLP